MIYDPKFDFSMEIFALFMLTGILSTLLIPETKQRSLEDISNEEQDGFVQDVPNHALITATD